MTSRWDNGRKRKAGNADRRNMWALIVMTIVVVASLALAIPPNERINQGLDIQGGLSVVLTANGADGQAVSAEEMEASRAIIESRVNALGASEATVQVQGDDQILVQIPGLSDTQTALDTIGKTGKLEFARLDSFTDADVVNKISTGQYGESATYTDEFGNSFSAGKAVALPVEEGTYTPIVTGADIERVTVGRPSEVATDYSVDIVLDGDGAEAFAQASRDLVADHGQIVIILDGEVQSAPAVQSEIPNGQVQITGNYTLDEAQALKTVLESGSLPVNFTYSQSQVVGPTLGQDALMAGVLAALIGIVIVMLYLLFFYKGLGIVTAGAVAVFAAMYLGLLALLSRFGLFSLSLAGVAGIVLTIGMAADSSVLTVERFREEIRHGRSVKAASITGVKHAIQTSIDADMVSLVSGLTLFFLASASVKGFGLTLCLGIMCDIVMMLLFKAPLIRLLAPRSIAKHPGFWNVEDGIEANEVYRGVAEKCGVPAADVADGLAMDEEYVIADAVKHGADETGITEAVRSIRGRFVKRDVPFLKYRKVFLCVAAACIVAAVAVMGVRGLDFGVEFAGGTSVTVTGAEGVSIEQVRGAFADAGADDAVVQTTSTGSEEGYIVKLSVTDAQEAAEIAGNALGGLGFAEADYQVTTIGPDWGASVVRASALAFIVSLVLIICYIAVRFRDWKMGVVAVATLVHDLVIVVGVYALAGHEFTPNAVAALLTILGYSLYDTVVVFHRITDNVREGRFKCSFSTMANHSLNQVLVRSVNTTLTSLIPVVAMLLFGGATLGDFAFAMAVGLVVGCYSSIGVATPLYSMWKTREKEHAKSEVRYGGRIGKFDWKRS